MVVLPIRLRANAAVHTRTSGASQRLQTLASGGTRSGLPEISELVLTLLLSRSPATDSP
jgi:hypothetical protein